MHVAHERRTQHPNAVTPFLFEGLELLLIWIVFGIIEGTLNVSGWSIMSYGLSLIWMGYTISKLLRVLKRQQEHKY
ncbi:hypothetical protein JHD50_11650 [Sulfurimonas sp. MAG313]|nr:hypothetical protein [Sulfurimonas sp. MAG313]MDF1881943.1 hypothetical protein [Sulfurimonas sp. MAG313]